MESLKCNKRAKNTAHESRKERRMGKVPGILYGKSLHNFMFEVGEMELDKEITATGGHGVINTNIDGKEYKALIKEIQRDPVNHKIIHIDLQELSDESKITTEVPLIFMGENKVLKNGGIIQKEKNSVKVQCSPENIPKYINVDISGMIKGDTYRVSDIEVSNEISIVDDVSALIASITGSNVKDIAQTDSEKVEITSGISNSQESEK